METENVISFKKFTLVKFSEILEGFYNRKISADMLEIYHEVFKKYEDEQIRKALITYLGDPKRSKFFPKPADIIDKIFDYKAKIQAKKVNMCNYENCKETNKKIEGIDTLIYYPEHEKYYCKEHYREIRPWDWIDEKFGYKR